MGMVLKVLFKNVVLGDLTMEEKEILGKVYEIIQKTLKTQKFTLYLIGSRSTKEQGKFSDFDFVVKADKNIKEATFSKIVQRIDEIKTLYSIDIADFYTMSDDFQKIAMKHAKEIRPNGY